MKPVKYLPISIQLAVAARVCMIIIFVECWRCIPRMYFDPNFYYISFVSIATATIIILLVRWATAWLDKIFDWRKAPIIRILMQLVLGIFVPALLDFQVMSRYLLSTGQKKNYIKFLDDYESIILFILILNLYYVIHYLIINWRRSEQKQVPHKEKRVEFYSIRGKSLNANIRLDEILYFHRPVNKVVVRTIGGVEYPIVDSLHIVSKLLQDKGFYLISRSVIINSAMVEGYTKGDTKRLRRIILKTPYAALLKPSERSKLDVTNDKIPFLKTWFGNEIEEIAEQVD